jgi:hypothetical protein
MKTVIQLRRPLRHLSLLGVVAVALVLLTGMGSARATTLYSYSGPHTLTWTSNGSKTVAIVRTGGYDAWLVVSASLSGSSKFSISPSYAYWEDTASDTAWRYDSTRYFFVSFSSSVADTSYGTLVLRDTLGQSDTIALIGYGTDDGIDFTLRGENAVIDTMFGGVKYADISVDRDSGNASSLAGFIYNHRDVPIDVLIILSDSSHWDVDGNGGSETLSLDAANDHTYGRTFQITYTPHGVYHDSVMVTMSCSSPHSQTTTFWIYVTDPMYAPHYYAPIILGPNLGANIGDNVCGTVTIFNPDSNAQPITLTAITPASNSYWSWSGLPSLPLTLQPGDSTTFTMCFAPGESYNGQYHPDMITVSYSDTSGLTGSVEGTAYGAVYGSCLESLRSNSDSLKLDEVIYGGYVEATESFIIHSDTELSAGSGVMYQGGSVQVISPSLPMRVHAGDSVKITFRVTPGSMDSSIYGLGLYYGYIPLYLGGCTGEITFQGDVTDSTSGALQLFSDQTELLALRSSTTTVTKTFDFVNSSGLPERVTSVSLANGSHFSITGYDPHAPVDTLYSINWGSPCNSMRTQRASIRTR